MTGCRTRVDRVGQCGQDLERPVVKLLRSRVKDRTGCSGIVNECSTSGVARKMKASEWLEVMSGGYRAVARMA
jgi:hypothetical protein